MMSGAGLPEDEIESKCSKLSHSNKKPSQTFMTFQEHFSSHILSDMIRWQPFKRASSAPLLSIARNIPDLWAASPPGEE